MNKMKRLCSLWLVLALLLSGQSALAEQPPRIANSLDEAGFYIHQAYLRGESTVDLIGLDFKQVDSQRLFAMINAGLSANVREYSYRLHRVEPEVARVTWLISESAMELEEARLTAQAAVDMLLAPGMTDREKYLALYDWLTEHTEYNGVMKYKGQTAWEALILRRALCNGYAKAFKLLCDLAALPCLYLSGTDLRQNVRHAWNMVHCDGQWLYVDATWRDTSKDPTKTYFMMTAQEISATHLPDADFRHLAMLLYPDRTTVAQEAEYLHQIGVLRGTGNGFELERAIDRQEAATMLIRLLGLEEDALAQSYAHPFTDVSGWAQPYIGALYHHGLTLGIGGGRYGARDGTTLRDYSCFLLTALGYEREVDFPWIQSVSFAISVGLISQTEAEEMAARTFTRGDMVRLSYRALALPAEKADSSMSLEESLRLSRWSTHYNLSAGG